ASAAASSAPEMRTSVSTVPRERASSMSARTISVAPSQLPLKMLSRPIPRVASANRPKSEGTSRRARTIVVSEPTALVAPKVMIVQGTPRTALSSIGDSMVGAGEARPRHAASQDPPGAWPRARVRAVACGLVSSTTLQPARTTAGLALIGLAVAAGAAAALQPKYALAAALGGVVVAMAFYAPTTHLMFLLFLTAVIGYQLQHRLGSHLLPSDAVLLTGLAASFARLSRQRLE